MVLGKLPEAFERVQGIFGKHPHPVSRTQNWSMPPVLATLSETVPPGAVNLTALAKRFANTWSSREWSNRARSWPAGAPTTSDRSRVLNMGALAARAACMTDRASPSARVTLRRPASIPATSSRSPITQLIWAAEAWMSSRITLVSGSPNWAGDARKSAWVFSVITVRGLRSSWLTRASSWSRRTTAVSARACAVRSSSRSSLASSTTWSVVSRSRRSRASVSARSLASSFSISRRTAADSARRTRTGGSTSAVLGSETAMSSSLASSGSNPRSARSVPARSSVNPWFVRARTGSRSLLVRMSVVPVS